jgi:hypothetical protein
MVYDSSRRHCCICRQSIHLCVFFSNTSHMRDSVVTLLMLSVRRSHCYISTTPLHTLHSTPHHSTPHNYSTTTPIGRTVRANLVQLRHRYTDRHCTLLNNSAAANYALLWPSTTAATTSHESPETRARPSQLRVSAFHLAPHMTKSATIADDNNATAASHCLSLYCCH